MGCYFLIYFIFFLISCIWNILNTFDTVQYKTNPDGIHANITVNINGIHFIARWVDAMTSFLFAFFVLCEDNDCCHHIVAPIKIGKMK